MPNDPVDHWKPSPNMVARFVGLLSAEPLKAAVLVRLLFPVDEMANVPYASTERRLRFIVEEALKQGHPVVADRRGYRLATTPDELKQYAGQLQRSADGLQRKAELVYAVCEAKFKVNLRKPVGHSAGRCLHLIDFNDGNYAHCAKETGHVGDHLSIEELADAGW